MKKLLTIIHFFILFGLVAQESNFPISYEGYRFFDISNCNYDNGIIISGVKTNEYDNESWGYGLLKKFDINGNELWQKLIGITPPPGWTWTTNITQTNDGGYIILGTYFNQEGEYGGDLFVLKLNSCAEKEWQKLYHSFSFEWPTKIYELPDGNFILQLNFWEMDIDPNKRIWVFKLDSNGNTIWKKYFADYDPWIGSGEMARDFISDKNGNYIMSGYYYHMDPEGDSNHLWLRPFVLKIDTAGNEIWHNILGIQDYFVGLNYKATTTTTGSTYSAGQKRFPNEACINKVDSSGNEIFKKTLFLNSKASSSLVISNIGDTSFFTIVGSQDSIDIINDVANYYLYKLDSNAIVLDSIIIKNSAILNYNQTLISYDNKIFMSNYEPNNVPTYWTGNIWKYNTNLEIDSVYTQNFVYDTLCPYPITNDTIALDTTTVMNLEHLWNELTPMSILPNPVKNKLNIIINIVKWQQRQLIIRDINGREILNEYIAPGKANHQLDVSAFENGIYIVSLFEKGKLLQTEKVVVSH